MVKPTPIVVGTPTRKSRATEDEVGERTPELLRSGFQRFISTAPFFPAGPRIMQGGQGGIIFGGDGSSDSGLEDPFGPVATSSENGGAVTNVEAVAAERPAKRRRKATAQPLMQLRRYSTRTQSKPATSMNRVWHLLPAELRERIWEMALEDPMEMRRIVYIRNRNTPGFPNYRRSSISVNFTVPAGSSISLVCSESRAVFMRKFFEVYQQDYRMMFPRFNTFVGSVLRSSIDDTLSRESDTAVPTKIAPAHLTDAQFWAHRYTSSEMPVPLAPRTETIPPVKAKITCPLDSVINHLDTSERQPVNPEVDIIYIEPCCDGCRGQHCISRQFLSVDRNAVRFLIVKDEPLWPPTRGGIPPCWETLTKVFPNVEIMYIDINNLGPPHSTIGKTKQRRVMVRVKDTALPRIIIHQTRFAAWKKDAGKDIKLAKIEFVAVYGHKEPGVDRQDGDQYPLALREGRRHKLADDVFIVR
ncbi:hypothetical protein MCOR25_002496 [Pyricularia grisea]|uniref:2EXR domain-containing protein n=1 Tax=Pyricularia grisea TaxID=148305 RepID=A0A6P8B0K1_PYRGI|nr:uncharacterized protein PgNI_06808 [Pyricularia grisea]KAI6377515.1 hypothetical protein MCOR25_002496 [Pyricularia grisea]TLD08440.1 hypothetical protein PgNI_06808 [Pyricularia grisea]